MIIFTGISSVVTQLVTIREFLAQFSGNEIVIALVLFSWLILGGLGTGLARHAGRSSKYCSESILGWLSMLLAVLPSLQIIAVRLLRDQFFTPGASVGFYSILFYTLLLLLPYCTLVGFALPYSLFIIRMKSKHYPGAKIYITDNMGDVLGGMLFSFILIYFFKPMQALLLSNLPLLISGLLLARRQNRKRAFQYAASLLLLLIMLAGAGMETRLLSSHMGKLIYYTESLYGRITVHRDRELVTLFENNIPMYHSQNQAMAEELIHFPLSQIDSHRNILLISAEGGVMAELKKYRPETVDYVELNPGLIRVLFKFGLMKQAPWLRVINQDGRSFLSAGPEKYDAIILSLPEPDTFQLNRFYTREFFDQVKSRLSPKGVFSFSIKGYDNYLSNIQQQKISSLFHTASDFFDHIQLLPGLNIHFLCANQPISPDIPALLSSKKIQTTFIRGYFHGNITDDRMAYLKNQILDKATVNSDLSPYLMRILFDQWYDKFSASPVYFLWALAGISLFYFYCISREEFVIFSTGFYVMGGEILVIFSFQIYFGYVYSQIGLIITLFLAGMLPGAYFGIQRAVRGKKWLLGSETALILLMAVYMLLIHTAGSVLPHLFFPLYGFLISLVCGFQFPLALAALKDTNPAVTRFFSADLLGAAAGTLVTSILLVPYLGIIQTAGLMAGIKLLSLGILSRSA